MIFMTLDHSRDFMTVSGNDPKNLAEIGVSLFLTRYLTNMCAPVFVFLAGLACALSLSGGKPRSELSKFLVKRGLWLIFLEWTVLRLAWTFDPFYQVTELQVIWAIGWSMLALAVFIYFPLRILVALSVLGIFAHNLLDGIKPEQWGAWAALWNILHEPGVIFDRGGHQIIILYPLIPWIFVMAGGYCFGFYWPQLKEKKWTPWIGVSCLVLFCILKWINIYGDPEPWVGMSPWYMNLLSFLKITKYPPSLDFLLVTLGLALLILLAFEKFPKMLRKPLLVFGKVPLFFYILHIYTIHLIAIFVAYSVYGSKVPSVDLVFHPFPEYGHSLGVAYVVWIMTLLILYPLCSWYREVKRQSKNPLLTYL